MVVTTTPVNIPLFKQQIQLLYHCLPKLEDLTKDPLRRLELLDLLKTDPDNLVKVLIHTIQALQDHIR